MSKDQTALYATVTARIIAQLEEGRLPWVQPWTGGTAPVGLPHNAATERNYSGINILILWDRLFECGYASQRWLTFMQAQALGGHVRKGEVGTTVCYADRFIPKAEQERARDEQREARQVAFLKRFTVFNVAQCDGLPEACLGMPEQRPVEELVPVAHDLLRASKAQVRIGGDRAFYAPSSDHIQIPPQAAYREPINWYRTALHELGHWTGHPSRLDRLRLAPFGTPDYAREELCAEMASAFLCALLGIVPTVRHADYIGAWLSVLREDEKAIFRAASQASKACDYLLGLQGRGEGGDHVG